MVIAAFRWAPVGYVTALRESSVLLAAVIGWRHLGERAGLRRTVAAGAVMAGLALLVAAR
jgi:drug/metabolite transporter (DMT)-like permease